MIRSMSLLADARLCLAESDADGTVKAARAAVVELDVLGAPFEAAMARLVAADGHQLQGDIEHADLERSAARDALASFGSEVWAERVDGLIGKRSTALAASTWKSWVMLQGVCSPFMLTTPIIGFAIAASSSPIARMKARCGARSRPSVVTRDRHFFMDYGLSGVIPAFAGTTHC